MLNGTKHHFTMDYECLSASQERWFKMTALPVNINLVLGGLSPIRILRTVEAAQQALRQKGRKIGLRLFTERSPGAGILRG